MNRFLIAVLLILGMWGLVFGYLYITWEQTTPTQETTKKEPPQQQETEDKKNSKTENKAKQKPLNKIERLRQKIKTKWLIANGDIHLLENDYMVAILTYQKVLELSPDNQEVMQKIADAYYKMNNFKKAYEYYKKTKEYDKFEAESYIKSLINYKWIHPGNIDTIKKEIANLSITDEQKFYYTTSLYCVISESKCRKDFTDYFLKHNNIQDKNLARIKKALDDFKNFRSKDSYYEATFLSAAFYENGFYFISLKIAENVLKEKRDYKPIIKIAAQSSYEIWNYVVSKNLLLELKKLDSHDPKISYFLARVYEILNEKTLAIVHYKKAIKDWYKDTADIYRRFIFIYLEHQEQGKMLKEFHNLVSSDTKKLNKTDFSLAIYYNIIHDRLKTAESYSRKAIRLFPESEVFYWYLAWIMLQDDEINRIKMQIIDNNVEKALKINKDNVMILMVKGILEYKQQNYNTSIIFLKKAYGMDTAFEYRKEIQSWLDKVVAEKDNNN